MVLSNGSEECIAQYDGVERAIRIETEGREQGVVVLKSLWDALDHVEGLALAKFIWADGICID